MKLLEALREGISAIFRQTDNAEMEEELRAHIAHRADDLERAGVPRGEAERRARIEFGGFERYRQDAYEAATGRQFFESVLQDVRLALRVLLKSPGFSIVAIATLALAIGANAVVFAVMNGLVLRPLHVPEAQSLYSIERGNDKAVNHSYLDYLDLRDRNRSFDGIAAYDVTSAGLDTGNNPSSAWGFEVTGNYFDVLKAKPYLGRFFHSTDEHGPNSAPYLVLTYSYWHTHFKDDRGVVGRVVQVNRHPYTILGVAPPDFNGTLLFLFPDFWTPIINQQQVRGSNELDQRGNRSLLMVLGHLKHGVTPAQAIADLNTIGAYLEKSYPKDDSQMHFSLTRPGLAGDWLGAPVREFLTGLMLLAGLILLASCANLASLFAARAADRSREVALRLALGSSRRRILRQVLTEAVLISLAGGVVGLCGSIGLLRWLSVWHPIPNTDAIRFHLPVTPDANVYVLALLLAVLSGLLFGAMPVRQILRTSPYEVIKAGPGQATGKGVGRKITIRELLLVGQIAICAVLVTSSMVAVRGLMRSLHSDFGFEPRGATLVGTNLQMAGYTPDKMPGMQKRMAEALAAIPGVAHVGLVDRPQLYYGANAANVFTEGSTDLKPANAAAEAMTYNISPGYFDAAQTSLLTGRAFNWGDDKNSPRVAVINREFANKIFGSVPTAVGRYFKRSDGSSIRVVGVVENGKYGSLTEDSQPALFLPLMQHAPMSETTMVVRMNRDQELLAGAIRSTLRKMDSGLPFTIQTWNQELNGAMFASRMATVSLGVLGVMGAMLSITGIFGMAAYSVSKRLRELGIRIALGAQRSEVIEAALGRALKLLAFGSAAGLLLGLLATRVLSYIVYQATPRDPLVLAAVVLAMALVGLAATWIPAQRALSVDPSRLLREE